VFLRGHDDACLEDFPMERRATGRMGWYRWRDRTVQVVFDAGRKDRLLDTQDGAVVFKWEEEDLIQAGARSSASARARAGLRARQSLPASWRAAGERGGGAGQASAGWTRTWWTSGTFASTAPQPSGASRRWPSAWRRAARRSGRCGCAGPSRSTRTLRTKGRCWCSRASGARATARSRRLTAGWP